MKPTQVYEFMKQFYDGADNVPFLWMDCNNEIGRERKKYVESNDAQTLLEYLKNKQIEDPVFFYAMEIDRQDGRIANFLGRWSVYFGLCMLWWCRVVWHHVSDQ